MSLGEDGVRRLTTFCGMSAGGDGLFWHWVSYPPRRSRACEAIGYSGDTRCQFGGDNLGVAAEGQNGQRTGDYPRTPMGRQAGGGWNVLRAERGWRSSRWGTGWHGVSDTRCQFGGDDLGVAVEEQNGQRPGDAPEPPMDGKRAAGEMRRGRGAGDGDCIGGDCVVCL